MLIRQLRSGRFPLGRVLATPILECFEQQTPTRVQSCRQRFGDELQFREFLDLTTRDPGLVFERERLQSPDLGEIGAFDAWLVISFPADSATRRTTIGGGSRCRKGNSYAQQPVRFL